MNLSQNAVSKLTPKDPGYPKRLFELKDKPKQIYMRGSLEENDLRNSIAVVGSRRMSRYGAWVVDRFVTYFVSRKITTISGYMYGVDTAVHNTTVKNGGKTIAVMGGGINSPYPPENDALYKEILKYGGSVLSEYEPNAKPKLWMYPRRNRIIAGLANHGVLVVEAGENSGSLITAQHARQIGKKVFAVPGPINSSVSAGTNQIIRQGWASLVTEPQEMFSEENQTSKQIKKMKKQSKTANMGGIEKRIFELLENNELTVDEISITLGIDHIKASSTVSMMCLNGAIYESAGKYYVV